MTTAAKVKARPRQQHLPRMGPLKNAVLEKIALEFVEARDAYLALKQPMIDKRHLLETKMKELKLTTYEFDGNEIVLEHEEHAVVRRKKKGKKDDA